MMGKLSNEEKMRKHFASKNLGLKR